MFQLHFWRMLCPPKSSPYLQSGLHKTFLPLISQKDSSIVFYPSIIPEHSSVTSKLDKWPRTFQVLLVRIFARKNFTFLRTIYLISSKKVSNNKSLSVKRYTWNLIFIYSLRDEDMRGWCFRKLQLVMNFLLLKQIFLRYRQLFSSSKVPIYNFICTEGMPI